MFGLVFEFNFWLLQLLKGQWIFDLRGFQCFYVLNNIKMVWNSRLQPRS